MHFHFHPDAEHKAGALIGAGIAFFRSMVEAIVVFQGITFDDLLKTIIWSFIGATVGYFTTAFWKWLKNRFGRRFFK